MALIRLIDLPKKEQNKIRNRIIAGTMKRYIDSECYVCYDEEEIATWKPRKNGRPIKELK